MFLRVVEVYGLYEVTKWRYHYIYKKGVGGSRRDSEALQEPPYPRIEKKKKECIKIQNIGLLRGEQQ